MPENLEQRVSDLGKSTLEFACECIHTQAGGEGGRIYVCVYVRVYIYVYIHTRTFMYRHIYIYIYTHTYTYIYVRIYIQHASTLVGVRTHVSHNGRGGRRALLQLAGPAGQHVLPVRMYV